MSKPSPHPITRRDPDRLEIPAIISGIAGRLNGERNWRDLYRVSWQVVRVGIYIGAGLRVVYTAAYPWIGGLFTTDPEVLGLFNAVFWMVILTQPINAVAFAFDGIYKGLGNGKILRNVLLVSTFGIFVPVILLTDHPGWQLFAVWTAFLVWMVVRCGQLALDFNRHYGAHAVH